jgi:uncharacterized MAPEG superfamily protein
MMIALGLFIGLSLLLIADGGHAGSAAPALPKMGKQMSTDLKILAWVAALTALMWLPYILTRLMTSGVMRTLTYEADNDPLPAWAARAKKAHTNAIENLAPFAAVVLVAHLAAVANATTALWATIYLWARVVHYVGYTAGVPFVRTLSFSVGWLATLIIFCRIMGWF